MMRIGIPAASLAALALGCSSSASVAPDSGTDVDADSDTDADTDSETATDTGPWSWTCDLLAAVPCSELEEAPGQYGISLYSPEYSGVSYVRASRSPELILAVRVEDEDGTPIVILLRDHGEEIVEVGLISPPAEQLEEVDIASPPELEFSSSGGLYPPDGVLGYAAVALLCADFSCALYGLAVDAGDEPIGLEPIPGGEVPLAESRAMTWVPPTIYEDGETPDLVCVAGDGVNCFDGETWIWEEAAAVGSGMLNAIDIDADALGLTSGLWVAGEDGRITTNQDELWTEIESGSSTSFISLSVNAGLWAAGGEGGFAFGDAEHAIACESETPYTAVFVHEEGPSDESFLSLTALAEDHVIEIVGDGAGFTACRTPAPFSAPPVDADYHRDGCIDAICGYALTARGLYQRGEYGGGME